jgi:hypothetical protein
LYNLLVTASVGQWSKSVCELERVRAITEFTDDSVMEKFNSLDDAAIGELMSYPCLFAYEEMVKGSARIGWLNAVKVRTGVVRINFILEKSLRPIPLSKLKKHRVELDIGSWEFRRTHWAVKDVDLLATLVQGGILSDKDIHTQQSDSRLSRFGLTRPASEISVRPSVFRVPIGKLEGDLVSVMMPFEPSFNAVYTSIKSACKDAKLRCQRADDIWNEAELVQDIFSLIYRSRVVICDLSGRNPNVFYEAGIAHTLGKTVIPIYQDESDMPFDLQHLRFIKYSNSPQGLNKLATQLSEKLRTIG